MRILAWETVGMAGSIAALDDDRILLEQPLPAGRRSAQTLAPAIQAMLAAVDWQPSAVELVATAVGPGSFTGLRVGLTTAKMFAYAVGCPIIGVNTLAAIAEQAPHDIAAVAVAMDAGRGQVFAASFARDLAGQFVWQRAAELLTEQAWLASLAPPYAATGPSLENLASRLPPDVAAVPREFWNASAAAIGRLGWQLFNAGQRDDPFQLVPLYLRLTAAEEQWERKNALPGTPIS
jgi:tRNA threonylcarbamoyladenosine biosynthesis protein TsaB